MAKTITQLPDASSVADGDELIVQQSGVTKRATKLEVIAGIKNVSIASDAAIAHSKLATLTAGNVILGNASNVPTSTALTGDVTISSSGVTTVTGGLVPAGAIMPFATSTAPTGWLKCNGAEVDIATYGNLATALYVGDGSNADTDLVYGYKTNGSGTRSTSGTHIKLPDIRGEFVRGWDDSRGIDSSRKNRSAQNGAIEGHTHTFSAPIPTSAGLASGALPWAGLSGTGTVTTNSTGGAETRPRNISALYCIKT